MWSTAKVIGTGPGEVGYTRGLSSWKKEKRKKQRGDEMLWKLWQSYRGFPLPPAFTGVTLPLAALPEHIEVTHHMEKPGFIYRAWGRPSRRSQQSSVIPIIKAKERPSSLALLSQLSCEFLRQKPTKIKPISLSLKVFMLLSGHTSSWLSVEQTHCFQKNFWQFSPLLSIRQLLYAVLSSIHNCLNSYKNSQIILISHWEKYLILFALSLKTDHQHSWGENLKVRLPFLNNLSTQQPFCVTCLSIRQFLETK